MLAFKVLLGRLDKCSNTYVTYNDRKMLLQNAALRPPNAHCSVCSNTYLELKIDTETKSLGYLVDQVLNELKIPGEITIEEGSR